MPGAGPTKVITDKGILEADSVTGELVLTALYPGIEVAMVAEGIGWPLRSRDGLARMDPPTERELHLLREVLDPQGLYLRK
jgi:glutaconate CoA-transferase subunit B